MTKVWIPANTIGDALIAVTDESIYLADPPKDQLEEIRSRLEGGDAPSRAIPGEVKNIPLVSIKNVTADVNDTDIDINYGADGKDGTKTLWLSSEAERAEVYDHLKGLLGERLRETDDQYNRPRAAWGPLMTLTVVGLLTWGLANVARMFQGAEDVDISGRHSGAKWLFYAILDFLGPIGVYVIGGIICAIAGLVLFRNLKTPPSLLVLHDGSYKQTGVVGTSIRYVIMLAIWFVTVRLVT